MAEMVNALLDVMITNLQYSAKRVHNGGASADDLQSLAGYLGELAEHGASMAALALRVAFEEPQPHQVPAGRCGDFHQYLAHVRAMFETAQTLASDAHARITRDMAEPRPQLDVRDLRPSG